MTIARKSRRKISRPLRNLIRAAKIARRVVSAEMCRSCGNQYCKNGECKHERRLRSRCGCGEDGCKCRKTYMDVGRDAREDREKGGRD